MGWPHQLQSTPSGGTKLSIQRPDGSDYDLRVIAPVHASTIDRLLIDVAALDAHLHAKVERAFAGIAQLKHVHDTFIDNVSASEPDAYGYVTYGDDALDNVYEALADCYHACCGTQLQEFRRRWPPPA